MDTIPNDVLKLILVNVSRRDRFSTFLVSKRFMTLAVEVFDPSEYDNRALMWAIEKDRPIVGRRLLKDRRVDPSCPLHERPRCTPIVMASYYSKEIFYMLLDDPRVDPRMSDNYAIRHICKTGKLHMLQRLLKHPLACEMLHHPNLLENAGQHIESVRILLGHGLTVTYGALSSAIYLRDPDLLSLLLKHAQTVDNNLIFSVCSRTLENESEFEMVMIFLRDHRIDPSSYNNHALTWASQNGYAEIVDFLLKNPRVFPQMTVHSSFNVVTGQLLRHPQMDMMKALPADILKLIFSFTEREDWFSVKLTSKRFSNFSTLVFDPSSEKNRALRWAIEKNKPFVLKHLLQDSRVSVHEYVDIQPPLQYACSKKGYVEIVEILLNHVVPTDVELRSAVLADDEETVKVLVSRMDLERFPDANDAIITACERGNIEIVKILLDVGINPSVRNNAPVRWASYYGHTDIVSLLLTDRRVDPSMHANFALLFACELGHKDVVVELLKDKRIDPSLHDNQAVHTAYIYGFVDIAELLLADHRVNPSGHNNSLLINALKFGEEDVALSLLRDDRVIAEIEMCGNINKLIELSKRRMPIVESLLITLRDERTRVNSSWFSKIRSFITRL